MFYTYNTVKFVLIYENQNINSKGRLPVLARLQNGSWWSLLPGHYTLMYFSHSKYSWPVTPIGIAIWQYVARSYKTLCLVFFSYSRESQPPYHEDNQAAHGAAHQWRTEAHYQKRTNCQACERASFEANPAALIKPLSGSNPEWYLHCNLMRLRTQYTQKATSEFLTHRNWEVIFIVVLNH